MKQRGRRPRTVVLRALKLGDLLTAVPALRALARAVPEHELVLAAPASLAPLAVHTGAVDRVVATERLGPLGPPLRNAKLAVNLHGRGPQSTTLLATTNPKHLVAFDVAGPPWLDGEHDRLRWCRLVSNAGIPADPADLRLDPPPIAVPPHRAGASIVHPGASAGARRWPVDRWVTVCRALAAQGHRVLVTGSSDERSLVAEVVEQAALPPASMLAGRTDLLALAAIINSAHYVVCGDTGVAHLAYAFGTPSVVLFGPTPPAEWGPPVGGPHSALWSGTVGDPHGVDVDPGLLTITPADVLEAIGAS